jgi:hypothetical protein
VVATRWVGTNVLETVAKKDGQVVGHGTYEVSLDGATLTATVAGTDAAGKPFEQVIVFDASQGRCNMLEVRPRFDTDASARVREEFK